MGGKKKKGLDINDHSKWGHRFEFRDRSQVQRDIFSPVVPIKREPQSLVDEMSSESGESAYSDKNLNAFDFALEESQTIPLQLPKAKTQSSKQQERSLLLKKRQREDSEFIVRRLVSELLDALETGHATLRKLETTTYFNCDLRYFNLDYVVEKFGAFDIVAIDPPWRIRGGQKNSDSPYMFSNNKFTLEYDTLSNQEIMDIPVEKLSAKGFCFLWVLSSNIIAGYECLHKWGYECIDHLIWVKTTCGGRRAMVSHGFYFLHSTETCLVGYKCAPGSKVEFRSKISNDLILADVRKKSQKPEQLYTIIDLLMPGAKKVEVFARNNNLREDWLSLGNQIGEVFENWRNTMTCDRCKKDICEGLLRYKSRRQRNFDVCTECIDAVLQEQQGSVAEYFKLENAAQEDVLHHYHKCDRCGIEPVWGVRFQCLQCDNLDYCENCYDEIIESQTGCFAHIFQAHEQPQAGHGLPVHHGKRCVSCYQKPILGLCFICADCAHLVLCQTCFFNCSFREFDQIKGHDSKHKIEIITLAQKSFKLSICQSCGRSPLVSPKYKCDSCFSYELCERCFIRNDIALQSGHTAEHTLSCF